MMLDNEYDYVATVNKSFHNIFPTSLDSRIAFLNAQSITPNNVKLTETYNLIFDSKFDLFKLEE